MKQDTLNKFKANAFDYLFKAFVAIGVMILTEVRNDLKDMMRIIPVHELRIGNLESNRLIDKFKAMRIPMKAEEMITYDTLTQN